VSARRERRGLIYSFPVGERTDRLRSDIQSADPPRAEFTETFSTPDWRLHQIPAGLLWFPMDPEYRDSEQQTGHSDLAT